jgi:hypothetical protein
MKVKIKDKGKQKTYNLIDKWSDVTLEKWMKLIDSKTKSSTEEAVVTLQTLTDMPKKIIKALSVKDVAMLMNKLAQLQSKAGSVLLKTFKINGVEYGMHPNLDEITLGEYADIETYIKDGIEKNMPEIMAVLFRPITERNGDVYTIEAYDGQISIRAEEIKKMSSVQVQNALVFFWHFGSVLLEILPSCLTEQIQEIAKQLQMETSQKDGDGLE